MQFYVCINCRCLKMQLRYKKNMFPLQQNNNPVTQKILFSIQALFVEFGEVKCGSSMWHRFKPSRVFMDQTRLAFRDQI